MAAPRYLNMVSGVPTQIAASESTASEVIVATNSGGYIDSSFLPPGVGVEVITLVCSENLADGDFVNIWNSAGTPKCRKADATTSGKEAHGYVLASFSSGASTTIYLTGRNTHNTIAGGVAGDIYLSTTAGLAVGTAPSSAGNVVQQIGVAYGTSNCQFNPGQVFILA